jgi:hypothetical protein
VLHSSAFDLLLKKKTIPLYSSQKSKMFNFLLYLQHNNYMVFCIGQFKHTSYGKGVQSFLPTKSA